MHRGSDQIRPQMKCWGKLYKHEHILQTYTHLVTDSGMPLRVIHHDTKISNILFDDQQNGLCVIDLDTVMPGYYLSDVGDMMRTYLSPANEEEADFSKIHIRENFFSAVCKGYLSEMGNVLSETEKKYFIFSGELMIYMQAIRFLTDFLNNDVYYGTKYPGHNLNRARNQFTLLNKYIAAEEKFKQLIIEAERDLSAVHAFLIFNEKSHLCSKTKYLILFFFARLGFSGGFAQKGKASKLPKPLL